MLLPFDVSKVTFENVYIKRVSQALGGSVSILDVEHYKKTGEEVFHRVDIPLQIARMFKIKYKVNSYLIPRLGQVMKYDGKVVAIERNADPSRKIDVDTMEWRSNMQDNFDSLRFDGDWYFDGLYAYQFKKEPLELVQEGQHLEPSGRFRKVPVDSVYLSYLNFNQPTKTTRYCVAFYVSDDIYSISAPIWLNLGEAGRTNDSEFDGGGSGSMLASFDGADDTLGVNLNFALKAATVLSELFGYETIEPLQIPYLMVRLNTINLPNMPKEVKQRTDIGMPITSAFAWILGLLHKAETPEQFHGLRQLTKYLTTKGFFWKNKQGVAMYVKEDKIGTDVPLLSS